MRGRQGTSGEVVSTTGPVMSRCGDITGWTVRSTVGVWWLPGDQRRLMKGRRALFSVGTQPEMGQERYVGRVAQAEAVLTWRETAGRNGMTTDVDTLKG